MCWNDIFMLEQFSKEKIDAQKTQCNGHNIFIIEVVNRTEPVALGLFNIFPYSKQYPEYVWHNQREVTVEIFVQHVVYQLFSLQDTRTISSGWFCSPQISLYIYYHLQRLTGASLIAQLVRIHLQCGRPWFDSWVGKIC